MSRVTTVIPVFNGERFLGATLESVAAQTRRPDHLVVIDDGSTDGTRTLIERFFAENSEVKGELLQNEKNLGLFQNLNRTLQFAATTDYLHILLADDLILPGFLGRLVAVLEQASAPALAFSLTEAIDQKGELIPHLHNRRARGVRKLQLSELLRRQSELQTLFCGSVLLKTNRQPSPCEFRLDMAQTADCVFYAQLGSHCHEIVEVGEILCQIRSHPYSATAQNRKGIQPWILDEWKAMQLAQQMMPETGFPRWLRRQKLLCLFAARSYVKVQQCRPETPEFADQIRTAARSIVAPHQWVLGKMVVGLRDAIQSRRAGRSKTPQ